VCVCVCVYVFCLFYDKGGLAKISKRDNLVDNKEVGSL